MTKLLTAAFVAGVLNIKPQSLRLRRMRGQGPPFIRLSDAPTARVFYPEAEFYAWLAARPRRNSTGEEKRDRAARGSSSTAPSAPSKPPDAGHAGSGFAASSSSDATS
jgi:hypothetical protein